MKFSWRTRTALVVMTGAGAVALAVVIATGASSGGYGDPESGLTEQEIMSRHATAVAQTRDASRRDALEFARQGIPLDSLVRTEINSLASIDSRSPAEAAAASDWVVLATSDGAFVDPVDGRLKLRLVTRETIKGAPPPAFEIALSGGPRRTPDAPGGWVLALAPYETLVAKGRDALFFLQRQPGASPSDLHERPWETTEVVGGRLRTSARGAWPGVEGSDVNIVVQELRDAVRAAGR